MRISMLITSLLCASSAWAQELPANVLMRCEGKLTINSTPAISGFDGEKTFEATLRLQNGELSDMGSVFLTTKGCQLRNGIVACSHTETVPTGLDKTSERRHLEAYLTRETGEYHLFLETKSFEGKGGTGKQVQTMKWHRSGVCRTVSKPVF